MKSTNDYLRAVENVTVLAIESSCDDTAAAVIRGNKALSNVASSQEVHELYGGVVPELASREHQRQIVPVVRAALRKAGLEYNDIDAIAYTRGPGLLGSLLVGASFAKSLSISLQKPLIEVHHMHAHILAHFIDDERNSGGIPEFPFLCLTVSGGHTQIVLLRSPVDMVVLGSTIDDAAGEAFDKVAKLMGLPYPGGPIIDRLAAEGDPTRFVFPKPRVEGLDFSFSGLKTSVLYFLKKELQSNPEFLADNKAHVAASVQHTIVSILIEKLETAIAQTGVRAVALAGGVSANSGLRLAVKRLASKHGIQAHVPAFAYCTDNAAMIGMAAMFLFAEERWGDLSAAPSARLPF